MRIIGGISTSIFGVNHTVHSVPKYIFKKQRHVVRLCENHDVQCNEIVTVDAIP